MSHERITSSLVALGGGPGGYVAAIRAAQLGVETVLVEAGHLGGVCLNEGCVPSKALIHDAASVADDIDLGLLDMASTGAVDSRFATSLAARTRTVERLRAGVAGLLRANGVRVVNGTGRLVDAHRIEVTAPDGTTMSIDTDDVVLATGSEPVVLPGLEPDGHFVLTAREVLALDRPPGRLVVIGGGYIGLELAGALHRFGTDVTVVEATDRLLLGIEPELADHLERHLRADGIDIRLDTRVVSTAGGHVRIVTDGIEEDLAADAVVVAVGRRPRSGAIGLDSIGVDVTDSGHVEVDEQLRTMIPHVFAIGDLTPGPALAHRAMAQGRTVAEVVAGRPSVFAPAGIPAVVFTSPEIATVGLRLDEARDRGIDADQVRFPLSASARGLTLGTDGFGLLVHDRDTGLVLGVHIVGPGAGELIGTASLALEMGAIAEDLASTIFPHPTLSEIHGELSDLALGSPVHLPPSAS